MQYPGTRITTRAAQWVKGFLRQKLSVRAVQLLTGIHWDTVRRIHKEMMDETLKKRDKNGVFHEYRDIKNSVIPDYDDFFLELKRQRLEGRIKPLLPVEASRGCWWGKCNFCGLNEKGWFTVSLQTFRTGRPGA